jgi:hypothetical protein
MSVRSAAGRGDIEPAGLRSGEDDVVEAEDVDPRDTVYKLWLTGLDPNAPIAVPTLAVPKPPEALETPETSRIATSLRLPMAAAAGTLQGAPRPPFARRPQPPSGEYGDS